MLNIKSNFSLHIHARVHTCTRERESKTKGYETLLKQQEINYSFHDIITLRLTNSSISTHHQKHFSILYSAFPPCWVPMINTFTPVMKFSSTSAFSNTFIPDNYFLSDIFFFVFIQNLPSSITRFFPYLSFLSFR